MPIEIGKLQDANQTIDNCRYCLMCRHVCPVGHVTALETLTPHGWGLLIASQRRGLAEWNEQTVEVMYSCADCGTCRAHCVTDQPLPEAIASVRSEIVAQHLAPSVAYELNERLQKWGNPYQEQAPETAGGQGEVALFVGDAARYLRPAMVKAAFDLLRAAGVEPVLIGGGRNNGYLASSLGFPETAKSLAEATLAELAESGASKLLVLTPGDFFAFNQLYPERLGIAWPQNVALEEVLVFLAGKLEAGALRFNPRGDDTPHAYVDPTHSVRVTTRYDAPRRLLAAVLPGQPVELYWRRERTHPTGSGALRWTNPHIGRHLTYARLGDAAEVGARLLVTEDPADLAQLTEHAALFNLRVEGLYELLTGQVA